MAEIYTDGGVSVGNGGYGNNGSFLGSDGLWALLIFAMIFGNNWGFGGNGGFGGGAGNMLYDINANTNRGFDNLAVHNELDEIQGTLTNGFTNIANSFTSLASNFQQCCCDNKLGIADLRYTVATENCADRQALNEGIRDIISSNTANTQAILDKLCQQEIDAKNDLIATLRSQLSMADLKASQTAQTAEIRANNATVANQLVAELRSCPIPAMPVYGNQAIFTCPNSGCGCTNVQ